MKQKPNEEMLTKALASAGLVKTLKRAAPFAVVAPNDDAVILPAAR
jgi:uncharacterized surface protein with fasciclin (FAS1) repeats